MLTVPLRLTVRTTDKPSLTSSQRSELTTSGGGGRSGKLGKAVRGGRLPQLSRLSGPLEVVVLPELLGHGSHLLQRRRTLHGQAFFLIAAMIALHKAIQIGSTRGDDIGLHAKTEQEAHQRGGEIPSGRAANQAEVVVKGEHAGQAMLGEKLGHHFEERFGIEIAAHFSV